MSTVLQGRLEVRSETINTSVTYAPDDVGMYTRQVEAFNRAVQTGSEPNASGMDGLRVVQVTQAFVESAKTGRTIKLTPVNA